MAYSFSKLEGGGTRPRSAESSDKRETITVHPNPAMERLHVTASTDMESVSILSAAGQILEVNKLSGENALLKVGHLPKGIYFLKVKTTTDSVIVKKFIKE